VNKMITREFVKSTGRDLKFCYVKQMIRKLGVMGTAFARLELSQPSRDLRKKRSGEVVRDHGWGYGVAAMFGVLVLLSGGIY